MFGQALLCSSDNQSAAAYPPSDGGIADFYVDEGRRIEVQS
jgi:hypothetical protein